MTSERAVALSDKLAPIRVSVGINPSSTRDKAAPARLAGEVRARGNGRCSRKAMTMTTVEEVHYSPVTAGRLGGWINRSGAVLCVFAVIFALWEIAVRALSVPDYILPSPSVIVTKIVVSWQLLTSNTFVTFEEILLGFALSVLVAVPLAIAVVYSGIFERVAFPFMVSLQTIPKVALAPILVMWLRYCIMPKIMVAFLISFFPIVINSVIGMRSAQKDVH